MRSHDGAVTVDSEIGAGSTFSLYFPVADGAAAETAPPAPADVRGRGEHLLYVDDEEEVVHVATRILERLGYRVTAATGPIQALHIFRSRPNDFDGVVTDLSMPGMSGHDLAREVRAIRPDIPLVLTSGHIRPVDVQAVQRLGGASLVPNPALIAELGPTLHRLLPGRPAARHS